MDHIFPLSHPGVIWLQELCHFGFTTGWVWLHSEGLAGERKPCCFLGGGLIPRCAFTFPGVIPCRQTLPSAVGSSLHCSLFLWTIVLFPQDCVHALLHSPVFLQLLDYILDYRSQGCATMVLPGLGMGFGGF